jgi:hypothetical protein
MGSGMQKVIEVASTFSVIVLDENEHIDMRGYRAVEGHLSEVYVKPDGAIGDKPSLAIVIDLVGARVVGQLSVEYFKAVMDAVVPLIACRVCGAIQSKDDPCVCRTPLTVQAP